MTYTYLWIRELQRISQEFIFGDNPSRKTVEICLFLIYSGVFSMIYDLWMSILMAILCTLTMKIYIKKVKSDLSTAKQFIQTYQWQQLQEKVCFLLQYIKYGKMIDYGYPLRSNTNIILHQQQTSLEKGSSDISKEEQKIQEKIIDIYQRLINLKVEADNTMVKMTRKKKLNLIQRKIPLSFKDIFSIYSNINNLITNLSEIEHNFIIFMSNPFTRQKDIFKMISFINTQLKNGLADIDKYVFELLGSVKDLQERISGQKLYKYLQDEQYSEEFEEQYQKMLRQASKKSENQTKTEVQQKSGFFYSDLPVDQVSSTEQFHEQKKEEIQILQERKKFRQKLDRILLLGMTRHQQQLQQEEEVAFQS